MVSKVKLENLYIQDKLSMMEISKKLNCSLNKVNYWMDKYHIKRRSISQALYIQRYPDGDPFRLSSVKSRDTAFIKGLGIGLYWGEGNKLNKYSIRIGNSDPNLLRMFIKFLKVIYGVEISLLKFGLQLFTDIDKEQALDYWVKELGVSRSQFYNVTTTISGSLGTYRNKSKYGVLTIHYHNKKLRDILVSELPK